MTMDKAYTPGQIEAEWYDRWEAAGAFAPGGEGQPYAISLPPPNVTGVLHMGHALDHTLQDVPMRFQRMRGRRALWLPGTDHAGIATQNVVERTLREAGASREDMGREAFVTRVWEWVEEYGSAITRQIRRLGDSVDWSRERFTLDEGLSTAVAEVFIRLYEKGLIYRGHYLVNWCPRCHTALSNEEVNHLETAGHLWHIRYPGADGSEGIVVATTRPETMLGDTAVAVHPDDERYRDLIGSHVLLPLLERELPVIADEAVDREFGTGAVKVTPAHDPNDWEMARRHDLEIVEAIDTAARITAEGGPYEGLDRFEAREQIVADLEAGGLLLAVEDHTHAVGHCQRCRTALEPALSDQWFVKMKPLAEAALEALDRGEPDIRPARWKKVYRQWLENIHDWCISRQLWWGHQIPVWHCRADGCGAMVASRTEPEGPCETCGERAWEQDPDVLDTWFSSWLWPFSTLGWPEETADLATFYPTTLLVSGYDILFFWDTRMVMAGLEFTGRVPFETLYIHGMIQDELGRPMSKSLGNGIDPIEMIDRYGADAVRYSLCSLTSEGQDIKLAESKFEMGRNFANKLWNASRFVLMNLEGHEPADGPVALEPADRWILSRLAAHIESLTARLENLKYADAARELYVFVWNEFCDWYLELVKERLAEPDSAGAAGVRALLTALLDAILRLLHPYMPFITSEIHARLVETVAGGLVAVRSVGTEAGIERIPGPEFLMTASWPEAPPGAADPGTESEMELIQAIVTAVRAIRGEMNIPPGTRGRLSVTGESEDRLAVIDRREAEIVALAGLEAVTTAPQMDKPPASASSVVEDLALYLPLEGLIDLEVERERLSKEAERLEGALAAATGKLANNDFLTRAPAEVVEREREKEESLREALARVGALLADLD